MANAVLIHPGSGSAQKNWPADRFIELSRTLGPRWVSRGLDSRTGGGTSPPEASAFEILDRPALGVLGATLAAARLYIGNDSGVSHLAAAVGAPTLALFGPTSDAVWRPDGPRVQTVRAPGRALAEISGRGCDGGRGFLD